MAELRIESLSKTFKDNVQALSAISIDVADREAVFLLGPSGAGKTTTLRLVAGLETATAGAVKIDGVDVTSFTPRERNVAMVYDRHSLFPHLSVFENLAYPLRIRRMSDAEIRRRLDAVAETLQISALLARRPSQLSGGQMQRVAIGRALVREAAVYLLDEPISHLDAQLRARMRVEFKRLQREFKATMLYVSHDQLEAMTMADRIVLINRGTVEQIAAPQDLFDNPASVFAATFVGEPAMNILAAALEQHGLDYSLAFEGGRLALDGAWVNDGPALSPGRSYSLGIRPQHMSIVPMDNQAPGKMEGRVFAFETLGSRVIFDIELNGKIIRAMTSGDAARHFPTSIGAPIAFRLDREFVYLFDAATGRTLRQAPFARKRPK